MNLKDYMANITHKNARIVSHGEITTKLLDTYRSIYSVYLPQVQRKRNKPDNTYKKYYCPANNSKKRHIQKIFDF